MVVKRIEWSDHKQGRENNQEILKIISGYEQGLNQDMQHEERSGEYER